MVIQKRKSSFSYILMFLLVDETVSVIFYYLQTIGASTRARSMF